MASFLAHLDCAGCGRRHAADTLQTVCESCASPLLARYDLEAVGQAVTRADLLSRPFTMWRYAELLPVADPASRITLGEGGTPLLPIHRLGAAMGLPNLLVKHEGLNPTGCFKDRGMAAAVSRAFELGATALVAPSAGNAGGALAAYAARAGLPAQVFLPADTPQANIDEAEATGARVVLVDGLIDEAGRQASAASREGRAFNLATLREPYRIEGKKTMGLELAEQLGWRLPDVVVYPTGGGTGLIGMWKAFAEMEALGWIEPGQRPRLVSVQATGCAPIVKAFRDDQPRSETWSDARTAASGLRVPHALGDFIILRDLKEADGTAVAVSDDDMRRAQETLGHSEGIFSGLEGAATLAAARQLRQSGWLRGDEEIVLFITSSGLKDWRVGENGD